MSDNQQNTEYEQLVAACDREAVYLNQLDHLKAQFKTRAILFKEGRRFDLTDPKTWLSVQNFSTDKGLILLDMDDEPLLVENVPEFFDQAAGKYFEALQEYYYKYQALREAKTAEEMLKAVD